MSLSGNLVSQLLRMGQCGGKLLPPSTRLWLSNGVDQCLIPSPMLIRLSNCKASAPSRKIQGSLDMSYGRVKDLQRERTETTISVAIEALIKF